jgi:16S rRNA G966 N2-methylase RsmD
MDYKKKYIKYKLKYIELKNKLDELYDNEIKEDKLVKLNYEQVNEVFPNITIDNYDKIKFTEESIYSVSKIDGANRLIEIIKDNMKTSDIVVTDGTANIGSDTISMAHEFNKINAIEYDKDNYEALKNNVKVLNIKNIKLYQGDTNEIIKDIEQDVLYVDPPWGGVDYKKENRLKLYMDKKELSQFYLDNKDKFKLFIAKVPKNYDINGFIIKTKINKVNIYTFLKEHKKYGKFVSYIFLVILN